MYGAGNEDAIIQNLKDAGCSREIISSFMEDIRDDRTEEGMKLLTVHRRRLLDELHKEQKKIDCLDYLIYKMKKQKD
ncbi:MAG: hypothetical protein K2O02_01870 [Lachnospiraceae bacterium]|nr:hypothetical protein [Lachnospiraceae bacterium]